MLLWEHRYEEAIPPLEKALALPGAAAAYVRCDLALALAGAGRPENVMPLLEAAKREPGPQTPLHVAKIYCALGDTDAAFTWLDRAADERCPVMLELPWMPHFDSVRSDDRYAALMKRMNLAP